MKKVLALVLVLMFCLVSYAESDWSAYTDEELHAMIDELSALVDGAKAELKSRGSEAPQKEVRVPVGIWNVPEDIPAGHYTINVAPNQHMVWGSIHVGTCLDETGKRIDSLASDHFYYEQVRLKGTDAAVSLDEIDYDFKDGDILIIEEADMLFTPYVKPKLGF